MSLKQLIKKPLNLAANYFGAHRRRVAEPRLWIMMYHRILPKDDPRYHREEPGMVVQPDTFAMHLETLGNEFELVSLDDWCQRAQQGGSLPAKACAITFDDGWLDNYEYAWPILQQKQVPATLYAVSELIGTRQKFWPNRLVTILQHPEFNSHQFAWAKQIPTGVDRELAAQAIYQLKAFNDRQVLDWIEQAEQALNIELSSHADLMDWQQLQQLAEHPLMTIGSHTCRHMRLRADLDEETMHYEVAQSQQHLAQKLTQDVAHFCYPNGDFTDAATALVAKQYRSAVTTQVGINHLSTLNWHRLLRIGVHEDASSSATQLMARVACWP